MRSPTVWSSSMKDVPLAVLMIRFRVVTGPIAPGSKSSRGRIVSAALSAGLSCARHDSGAHTANDRDAGSSAGVIVMTPSAMRRSNSAHTAAGSASTSYTAMNAWLDGGLPSTGCDSYRTADDDARDEARVRQMDVVVPGPELVGASLDGVRRDHERCGASHLVPPRDSATRPTRPSRDRRPAPATCARAWAPWLATPIRPSGMNSMTRMISSPEKTVWYPEK